ncbi:hypothetical protein ACJJTC_013999 [Scirpophaga incertulas]
MSRGRKPLVTKQKILTPTSPTLTQNNLSSEIQELKIFFDTKLETIKKDILDELSNRMSTFKEAMHLIIQQHHDNYTKKLDSLDLAISNFKDEQDDISKRVSYLSDDVLALKTKLTTIENENANLKSKLSELEGLQQSVGEVEQRARLNNLEIFGVPERKSEDLLLITSQIASAVGGDDHCTGWDSLLSAARKKRGLTTADINIPGDVRSIYVNEHLTPRNKTLLKLTRAKCKELGFQNVWTRNTKIYVRKHVKSPAIRIFNFEQIDKLGK